MIAMKTSRINWRPSDERCPRIHTPSPLPLSTDRRKLINASDSSRPKRGTLPHVHHPSPSSTG